MTGALCAKVHVATCILILVLGAAPVAAQDASLEFDYSRVADGFQAETFNDEGYAAGNGFTEPNRWGPYTAYLMETNEEGQRTWRIENYLPRPGRNYSQGSTMYLVEGNERALLIDTAQRADTTPGENDLKTLVRFLLDRDNQGNRKIDPLHFVVANTHNHGDHTGENALMSDRTIYYPDLDWPAEAPLNYLPIREGGGTTDNGPGEAVGEIDLGGRVLEAVAVPPHSSGSTAYLDAANRMLFTGDAMGSGYPFLQRGPITTYRRSARHVERLTRDMPDLIVLPAHSYQAFGWGREYGLLDRQYVEDSATLADGIVDGTIIGEPFATNPTAMWAQHDSAQIVYGLESIDAPGESAAANYRAMVLASRFTRAQMKYLSNQDISRLDNLASQVFLIHERDAGSMYLVKGSDSAVLIGTGTGTSGLAAIVDRLAGPRALDVVLLNGSDGQAGGLSQVDARNVFVPAGVPVAGATSVGDGALIELGDNGHGSALRLEVTLFDLPGGPAISILSAGDRTLFIDDSFGSLRDDTPLEVADPVAYQVAFNDWWSKLIGRVELVYPSNASAWYTSPDRLNDVNQLLFAINQGRAEWDASDREGWRVYRSSAPRPAPARILAPAVGAPDE